MVSLSVSLLFPVSLDILISDEKKTFEKYIYERKTYEKKIF